MKPGTIATLASRATIAARTILDNDRRCGRNGNTDLLVANLSILASCRAYASSLRPFNQQLHQHIEILIDDLYWSIEGCVSWNPDGLMRVIYHGH